MQLRTDTIVALSTAPGRSAIAIVRLSGPDAHHLAQGVTSHWPERPREATLVRVHDPVRHVAIDDALLTRFDAPRSYTGEPLVEFACHGGTVPTELIGTLIAQGARMADPGEFTQRAVLNGKLDLLQAEAVGDLIDATTTAHRVVALSQLHGGLSQLIGELREELLHVEALLAYDLDFPEEDDGPVPRSRIRDSAAAVLARVDKLIATAPLAEVARDGALVVIAGLPNAGKSSLFNALVGEERAIVTEVPGTTRDAIESRIERQPWPLRLVDTAGLRPTQDRIERLGIEVSERHIRAAHLVLACGDSIAAINATEHQVQTLTTATIIRVHTKADLATVETNGMDVTVSAHTRHGLSRLKDRIDRELSTQLGVLPTDGAVIMRARHRTALENARADLSEFISVWSAAELPATIAAVYVRGATVALEDLIGTVEIDQVMERVFRTFCVGK